MKNETERTDRDLLYKGLQQLGICLVLMFLGPSFLFFILSSDDKAYYIPLLIFAILICLLAIIMLFKGINTIMNSMFKKK